MSDDKNTLAEYLIKIGVDADEASMAKFGAIIGGVAGFTSKLVDGLVKATEAVADFVPNATAGLEDLYWASKRLKSSVADIQDFELGMTRAGSSAAKARNDLESLAAFRRTNPMGDSLLGLFGVTNASSKGDTEVMDNLISHFKQLNKQGQYFLAARQGAMLGFGEQDVWSMVHTQQATPNGPIEDKFNKDYKALGQDSNNQASVSHDFQNTLRDFNATKKVVGNTAAVAAAPLAGKAVQLADKGLISVASAVAPGLTGAAKALMNSLPAIKKSVENVAKATEKFAGATAGMALDFGNKAALAFAKSIDGLLSKGEGGYNSINLGKKGNYKSSATDLVNTSIADVQAAQARGDYNAAGRFQMTKDTLAAAVKALHLDTSQKFDPAMQERIFGQYLLQMKRPEISDYIKGKSNDLHAALLAASKEWASVADPNTGKSHYAGVANNKASISDAQFAAALQADRAMQLHTPFANTTPLGAPSPAGKTVTIIQHNNTTINGAKDAHKTASSIGRISDRTNGDLVRNLSTAAI